MTRALNLHWVLDGIYCHLFDGITFCSLGPPEQCFFLGPNFAKFRPEKYDLDLDKGFFIEKMIQIRQILKEKKKSKSPDFYNKFQ
jgi:hypothetical protein